MEEGKQAGNYGGTRLLKGRFPTFQLPRLCRVLPITPVETGYIDKAELTPAKV